MKINLWTRLVIPLLLLSILMIFVHKFWEGDSFFLNLATELVGILITICYVDWILREYEKRRWLSTDERIAWRLRILLNAIISGLRDGLGFGIDVLDERVVISSDKYAMHKDVMRVGEHVIVPAALGRIQKLDQNGWKKLVLHIQNSLNDVQVFLNMFQTRLIPNQISDILDLQESLSNSLTHYSIFPDIMGVSEDKLPQTRTPALSLQQFGCESTAEELRNICNLAKKISESTNQNVPSRHPKPRG